MCENFHVFDKCFVPDKGIVFIRQGIVPIKLDPVTGVLL